MNQPHIQVYQALVYNGGFATARTLLWNAVAIGVRGTRHNFDCDGWKGHVDKTFAERRARNWALFTGWEIVDAGRVPQYDDPDRNDSKGANRA